MATVKDAFTGMRDDRDEFGVGIRRARVVRPVGHARFLSVRKPPKAESNTRLTAALAGGIRSVLGLSSPGSRGMPAFGSPASVARALASRSAARVGSPTVAPISSASAAVAPARAPRPTLGGPPPSTTPFTPGATTVISPTGQISVQPLIPTEAGPVLAGQRTDDPFLRAIGPKLQDLPELKKRRLEGLY